MSRKLILIAALMTAASSTAFAQYYSGHSGTREEQTACRRDALHLCRGVSEDSAVRQCLIQHWQRVSGHCRRVISAHGS